jgi:hypothetical protein
MNARQEESARRWVAKIFSWVEDVVYVGLGVLLAGCALTLLASGGLTFWHHLMERSLPANIVQLLDRLLLILLIIEVMYTVQVSFREHSLAPEPFLIVDDRGAGRIAGPVATASSGRGRRGCAVGRPPRRLTPGRR